MDHKVESIPRLGGVSDEAHLVRVRARVSVSVGVGVSVGVSVSVSVGVSVSVRKRPGMIKVDVKVSGVCKARELDLKWRQDCCEQEVNGHDNVPDRHLQKKGGASAWVSRFRGPGGAFEDSQGAQSWRCAGL